MSWSSQRDRFPVLARYAYLNAGTNGPLAASTSAAAGAIEEWQVLHGRSGKEHFEEMLERRERVRALLAGELGVPAETVALTDSTSRAVQIVIAGLEFEPDDEILTTDSEHFGLLGPLTATGARLRIAPVRGVPPDELLDLLAAQVTPRTRLIALSAVLWLDGTIVPWQRLRERTGVPILVDGAQSVGAIPVDATAADYYTVSAQKWLCAPDATGALYVREPEALPVRIVSYLSAATHDDPTAHWEAKPGGARFDSGLTPGGALAGLEAALTDLPEGRFDRARELAGRCRELLVSAGYDVVTPTGQATLVSFRAPGEPAEVRAALYERDVVVRDLPGTDLLRASVGWWNDESDLARLVDALSLYPGSPSSPAIG